MFPAAAFVVSLALFFLPPPAIFEGADFQLPQHRGQPVFQRAVLVSRNSAGRASRL
jgi:hypothetical protein